MRNHNCQLCPRHQYAKTVCVWGSSIISSTKDIMVIIDNVSSNTDTTGIPTSGTAGNLIIKILTEAGILDRCYVTPAVKCYAPHKAKITEIRPCRQYLMEEINQIKPKLIIALGSISATALFGKAIPIKQLRQRIFPVGDTKVGFTFSHNVVFTDPVKYQTVKQDVKWILNNYEQQQSQEIELVEVRTDSDIVPLLDSLVLGFDIESTGLKLFANELLTFSFSPINTVTAYGFNIGHPKDPVYQGTKVLEIFSNPNVVLIGHSIKFDIKFIEKHYRIKVKCQLIDVAILHTLLDENSSDNSLKNLAALYTKFGHYEDDIDKKNLINEPYDKVIKYNGIDSVVPHQLLTHFLPQLQEQGLDTIAHFLMEMLPIFVEMELDGIHLNLVKLKELFDKIVNNLNELIRKYPAYDFQKPAHIAKLLYHDHQISQVTQTKTGKASTRKDVLQSLKYQDLDAVQSEALKDVLFDRSQRKVLTIITGKKGFIPNLVNSRLHTTFNLSKSFDEETDELKGTVTGRLSSSNPNLQNIPNKDDKAGQAIRECFEVTPGWKYLVFPDYSQIELRIAAFLSREPVFLQAFNEGLDLHTTVMCDLLHEDYEQVNKILKDKYPTDKYQTFKDYRLVIKRVNFGIFYGMWIDKFLQVIRQMDLNMTEHEGKEIINNWYKRHTKLLDWIHTTENVIIKQGEISTIFGRKRRLKGADRRSHNGKRLLRQGINFVVQSAASDTTMCAMYLLYNEFKQRNNCRLNLTIHDQIIYETQDENIEELVQETKNIMEVQVPVFMKDRFGINLDVPLEVDCEYGQHWK